MKVRRISVPSGGARKATTGAPRSGLPSAALLSGMLASSAIAQSGTAAEFLDEGTFIADARLRYEFVDQEGFERDANGLTFRLRYGYETGRAAGFGALVEGDFTRALEPDRFNSTVNGKSDLPVIADPKSSRLNRFQLLYDGIDDLTLSAGRQRIILDNARFIGNVGWRQNEQTYDAVRLQATPVDGVRIDYSYAWQVNRIFGSNSADKNRDLDSHFINTKVDAGILGTATAYAYLLEFEDFPGLSSKTFGANLVGSQALSDRVELSYHLEYAHQRPYADNESRFRLNYVMADAGINAGRASLNVRWELLEGDGENAFQSPLATLHAHQGFADALLTTPASGLTDLQFYGAYRLAEEGALGPVTLRAWFHDYSADRGSTDPGEEIDIALSLKPKALGGVSILLKHADYFGAETIASRRKFWFGLSYKY